MSDIGQITPEQSSESFDRCEQCHAPVDRDQRYCVNCGAHRRGVPDPAATYMSRATARPGARGGLASTPAGTAAARRGAGSLGLLGALALALIPVAAAVGILIGRSSNNQDGKLIQALERQRAQVTTTQVSASGTPAASGSTASGATPAAAKQKAKTTSAAAKAKAKAAAKSKTAAVSSTSSAKVTKVTGTKVTASQQTQGSSEAKKVQSSTGKNYVQADNNLPSSVVVGP